MEVPDNAFVEIIIREGKIGTFHNDMKLIFYYTLPDLSLLIRPNKNLAMNARNNHVSTVIL